MEMLTPVIMEEGIALTIIPTIGIIPIQTVLRVFTILRSDTAWAGVHATTTGTIHFTAIFILPIAIHRASLPDSEMC